MGTFVKVATRAEISERSAKLVKIGDRRIALFNVAGQFFAIDNACPHADGPLSEGEIEGDEVECPWHGSRFNIKTGAVTAEPAGKNVRTYNLRVTGDDIEVEV